MSGNPFNKIQPGELQAIQVEQQQVLEEYVVRRRGVEGRVRVAMDTEEHERRKKYCLAQEASRPTLTRAEVREVKTLDTQYFRDLSFSELLTKVPPDFYLRARRVRDATLIVTRVGDAARELEDSFDTAVAQGERPNGRKMWSALVAVAGAIVVLVTLKEGGLGGALIMSILMGIVWIFASRIPSVLSEKSHGTRGSPGNVV